MKKKSFNYLACWLIFTSIFFIWGCKKNNNTFNPEEVTPYVGDYEGTFTRNGAEGGSWEVNVNTNGVITGSGLDISFEPGEVYEFSITGSVDGNGKAIFGATLESGQKTADFQAVISSTGHIEGTWVSVIPGSDGSGTLTGERL